MSRKKKELLKQLEEADNKLKEADEKLKQEEIRKQEIERLTEEAEKEEFELVESTRKKIEQIAEENGFFCGIYLQKENVLAIVQLALETNEDIQIPFNLYFKEN